MSRTRRRLPSGATARAVALLRCALAVLAALIALAPTSSAYARLLAGEPPHVCHCDVRDGHASCACSICFPELRDDADRDMRTIKGVCGDESPVLRSVAQPAIVPAGFVAPRLTWREAWPSAPSRELLPRSSDPPEPRPPRAVG